VTDTLDRLRPIEIQLGGDIDLANATFLAEELCDAVERAHRAVLVDITAVTFIDASGLSMMLTVHHHAIAHGRTVTWRGAAPLPTRLFRITGLDRTLHIET
jgi:anti-sigma B factor antagonist